MCELLLFSPNDFGSPGIGVRKMRQLGNCEHFYSGLHNPGLVENGQSAALFLETQEINAEVLRDRL